METIGKPIALILKEELLKRQRKNEGYSLRAFSKAMGLSSSFVSKVLSGKKNLSEETILLIASRLKLEGQALEDFSFHLEKNKNVEFEELNIDNFQYISDWQHYALLELLTLSDFKSDVFWIAEKLDISIEKVESSLARLERINLIARDKKGNFSSYNKNLTTVNQKAPSSAHTEHERQLLKKALEALDSVDPAERSQSSMTMAIPSRRLKEAREKIKLFQREMNSLLQRKGPRDSVYNLSISFFPLTETKKTKKRRSK